MSDCEGPGGRSRNMNGMKCTGRIRNIWRDTILTMRSDDVGRDREKF